MATNVLMVIEQIDNKLIKDNKTRIKNVIKNEYDIEEDVNFNFFLDNLTSVEILKLFIELKNEYKKLTLECFVKDNNLVDECVLNSCDKINNVKLNSAELYKSLVDKNKDIFFIINYKNKQNELLNICKEKNKNIILIKI